MARSDIDGGWAWVILFISFCGMVFHGSMVYSAGVIMVAMLDEIDSDLTKISWITAIFISTQCLSGPLVGFITNKFGCRVSAIVGGLLSLVGLTATHFITDVYLLILTFSLLTGVGIGFIYCTSIIVIGYYFDKLRPIASGITVSGAACGMFIGPPIIRLLIDIYEMKGAFLIIGAILANFCALGMLMRPSPTEKEKFKNSSARCPKGTKETHNHIQQIQSRFKHIKVSIRKYLLMFRNLPFVCYLLSSFALWAGDMAAVPHLPNYAEQQGTSKMAAATLMTAMGITSLLSRLLTGFAASDPRIGPGILHMGLLGIIGILTITFPLFSHSFVTQIIYSAGYGLYCGGLSTIVNPLTTELVTLENLASGFGLLIFSSGMGSLVGTPIAGMIVDNGGRYSHSYIFAGAMLLFGSFVAAPIALRKKKESSHNSGGNEEITIDVPAQVKTTEIQG